MTMIIYGYNTGILWQFTVIILWYYGYCTVIVLELFKNTSFEGSTFTWWLVNATLFENLEKYTGNTLRGLSSLALPDRGPWFWDLGVVLRNPKWGRNRDENENPCSISEF